MPDINVPKIGPIKKPVVIAVGVAAAAIVGWRYWQSRTGTGADVATTSDYADGGTIPAVAGAVSPDNSYGSSGQPVDNTQSSYGFHGTTNDQWVQYATTQLTQSTDWSYTDIVSALGNFITNKPVSTLQQQIIQAAIGLAGYPPVGSHTVIPGGDTPISIAPTITSAIAQSTSTVKITWTPVAGAAGYYIYRDGASTEIGAGLGTWAVVSGLNPGTSYTFHVAGHTAAGKIGPHSAGVTAKTFTSTTPVMTKPETAIQR